MISRLTLGGAAILLMVVAVFHGLGANPLAADLEAANLKPFTVGAFRAVWVGFSLTSIALAGVLVMAAIRPAQSMAMFLLVLSAIPLGSALLIYMYVGNFLGGHLLLVSGAFIVAGALWLRAANNALQATCEDARA